ncbi:MAG TPA: bifunctional adenosylcobinamide kinase/adenosylcobinamide-phosphate guanylyltransferase [Sedimentibacter sp.]|mgnify:FL=1|nr:bifunctional adenosylcobinamide kinase/adenosylcobinamide-phosphate guanylyltransferase [Sedimentibacter sp.]HOH69209.1 bifunctional adenosylcobinamide kinase/adenosylcobinamide-phosphate guanylyltransferase [Sedimentibacter sp.]HPW99764.1 bifunctional adenosylcobinamide kinase/adenosylcobinamide-phosphate guanylyltransferase [Sedimentibacter sp.]
MSLTFVIGGARSGKSTFAEAKAKEYSQHVLYIASAVVTDQAMADRVKRHREQRPASWHTLEAYGSFDKLIDNPLFVQSQVILFDCITTMIANYMVDSSLDFDTCSVEDVNILEEKITSEVFSLIDVCNNNNKKLIIVSNETGMGLVPSYYMGNYFRDISGRINSRLGLKSDNMYFIFSGIPIKLKDKGEMVKWPQDF